MAPFVIGKSGRLVRYPLHPHSVARWLAQLCCVFFVQYISCIALQRENAVILPPFSARLVYLSFLISTLIRASARLVATVAALARLNFCIPSCCNIAIALLLARTATL